MRWPRAGARVNDALIDDYEHQTMLALHINREDALFFSPTLILNAIPYA